MTYCHFAAEEGSRRAVFSEVVESDDLCPRGVSDGFAGPAYFEVALRCV